MAKNKQQEERNRNLPIEKNEDVEFAAELADADDLEAAERGDLADARQQQE